MLSNMFETEQIYNSGASNEYSLENLAKQSGLHEGEEWGESDMDMESFGLYQINQQLQHLAEFEGTNNLYLNVTPQSLPCGNENRKMVSINSEKPDPTEPKMKGLPSSSLEILNKFKSRSRKLNGENINFPSYETECKVDCGLSIETIIQLAAEKFIQSISNHQTSNEISVLSHPYPSSILCDSEKDLKQVQLVQNLLSCAEKVDEKQYERARKLLLECDRMSYPQGTHVQRLVFHFTQALYEKIDRETGNFTLGKKVKDPLEALKSPDETQIAFHKELPLSQITKFAGIQAVVDNVAEAKKIHFIDLEIRKGIQCTILMQALAARCENPIEHLKITAFGTTSKKASLEETGRQLMSFANSLDLQFSFKVVMVENILDLDENLFELDGDEAIAVNAAYTLTHMIGRPDQLEHLMRVIRRINIRVMVVSEVEANCNSPIFVDRFVEALVFYGACFESMADCMKNDEKNRCFAEATCFSSSIRNIVATEGDERKIRHVSISVWRAFFARFGFEETELSMSSVYQANLVLKNFISGNSYNFDIDGKSLIIKWKGTTVSSLSAWKLLCC